MGQETSRNANEILAQATPEQVRWVTARLTAKSDHEAAKAVGVHPSTVSKWPNKADLDAAVRALLTQTAAAAVLILSQAAPQAAQVLVANLKGKQAVPAANSILDRCGVTGEQHVSVTVFDLAAWKQEQEARRREWDALDAPPAERAE